MSIPVSELTENDYRILDYINKFPSVSKSQIIQYFSDNIDAIDFRLRVLAETYGYITEEFNETDDDYENPPKSKDVFHISPLGITALQAYLAKKKTARFERILLVLTLCASIVSAIAAIISAVK